MATHEVALEAAIGAARHDHFEAFLKRDALADAEFGIRRWREKSRKMMSLDEEDLAAELEIDGIAAWSRLYDTLAGTLEFTYTKPDGSSEVVPMSRRRSMLGATDRTLRRAVFEGSNKAWEGVQDVCGAAINAIAGARLTLVHRRSQNTFLDPAVYEHRIGLDSLEALRNALVDRAEVTRSLLRLKAKRLGVPAISWFDLEAPTPGASVGGEASLSWEEGVAMIEAALAQGYPALGRFTREIVEKRWIDYTPRRGKRPGGFCTSSTFHGESRIFMTFDGAMGDVITLAHEIGHAWHSQILRHARPLARNYPMTLAESASTFAEMIFIEGVLSNPSVPEVEKRRMVDSQVRQATGFLLDVPMRYEFERNFHKEREEGEISVTRLKELMVAAQRTLFGDALADDGGDEMFWASKLHFYIAEVPFYNFPYTVGFLLSCALFARFKEEGAGFLPTYEAFLSRTGSATCEALGREVLGVDLERPEFWAGAIESVAGLAGRFEALFPEK